MGIMGWPSCLLPPPSSFATFYVYQFVTVTFYELMQY